MIRFLAIVLIDLTINPPFNNYINVTLCLWSLLISQLELGDYHRHCFHGVRISEVMNGGGDENRRRQISD